MAAPAEPVKPVSQASRCSDAGTYSFWWRSECGTMKPVKPRRANSVRSAAGARAAIVERLEAGLEHGGNLLSRLRPGNASCRMAGTPVPGE